MELLITPRNFQIRKVTRQYIEKKLHRLERFESQIIGIGITISKVKDTFVAEAHLKTRTTDIHCREKSNDSMHSAIDRLIDVIESKMKKEKEKISDKRTRRSHRAKEEQALAQLSPFDDSEDGKGPSIIRVPDYRFKPLFPEDAMVELQNSSLYFLVFINAQTEGLSVMYKRHDGNFGLIEY